MTEEEQPNILEQYVRKLIREELSKMEQEGYYEKVARQITETEEREAHIKVDFKLADSRYCNGCPCLTTGSIVGGIDKDAPHCGRGFVGPASFYALAIGYDLGSGMSKVIRPDSCVLHSRKLHLKW